MPTTPVQALPYPALSDPANGPVGLQNLALALEDYKTIVRCTSSTRPAHVEGRVIYETDTDQMHVSDGGAWRPVMLSTNTNLAWDTNVVATNGQTYRRGDTITTSVEFKVNLAWGAYSWAMFTMPVGYRPPIRWEFSLAGNNGAIYPCMVDSGNGAVQARLAIPNQTTLFGSWSHPYGS